MIFKKLLVVILSLLFSRAAFAINNPHTEPVKRDTMSWLDKSRNRAVPVAIYRDATGKAVKQLVVLSPGYLGKYTDYAYIANDVARQGYLVLVVQHNLPSDPKMPSGEDLFKRRLPFWETGIANIFFAIRKIKELYPGTDTSQIILIGHSNGGDISMLMASRYPGLITKVISLDNRRVPFPRAVKPSIFSIRSQDQVADTGVLPTMDEQRKYHITIVSVNTDHDDMGGYGNATQLNEINGLIKRFLTNQSLAGPE